MARSLDDPQRPLTAAFHPVRAVDPDVPLEREAVAVFAQWAARLPSPPRDAAAHVRKVVVRPRLVGRLTSTIVGRRLAWRIKPSNEPGLPAAPATTLSGLDVWNLPPDLRAASIHNRDCKTCLGSARVTCGACGGFTQRMCSGCSGHGKSYQHASNGARRLMNCRVCDKRGYVDCKSCAGGLVACGSCEGRGKLVAWLEVDDSARDDVQVEPDGEVTRAFWWASDGTSASEAEIDADARTVCEVSVAESLDETRLPAEVTPAWREAHWAALQPQLQKDERAQSQRFALLDLPAVDVTYGDGRDVQTITFEGRRLLAPPIEVDRVFAARAQRLGRWKLGLLALPVLAALVYLARGSWFMTGGIAALVGLVGVAALTIYLAVSSRRRPWLAAAAAALVGAGALAVSAEPSREHARALMALADHEGARAELEALGGDLTTDADLRAITLAEVLSERDLATAEKRADLLPPGSAERAEADRYVDALLLEAARAHFARGELDAADAKLARMRSVHDADALALKTTVERARAALLAKAALARGRDALAAHRFEEALAHAKRADELGATEEARALREAILAKMESDARLKALSAKTTSDLEARVRALDDAAQAWRTYAGARATQPAELAELEEAGRVARAELGTRRAAAEAKRAAEEKREAAKRETEAKRAAARAEREERSYYRSAPRCVRGCPCGNSCISCSKRCRH